MNAIRLVAALCFLAISGCTHYTTPGGPARISELGDADIQSLMQRQPAAQFPARIAVARIQAGNYRNQQIDSYGQGQFSLITVRESESDLALQRLQQLQAVTALAPLNRIIVSPQLDSLLPLRQAAARLKADLLLVYTFDSQFRFGEQSMLPLNIIALGSLSNKPVAVTTTASAALFDVRTEYLYGLAEASETAKRKTSVWSSSEAVDELRLDTETRSFDKLTLQILELWPGLLAEYSQDPKPLAPVKTLTR